mgnify:CR=1 FL=1
MGTTTSVPGNSSPKPGVISRFQSIADTPGEPNGFMADGSVMDAFNLLGWVEENSAHFKPPVGNKYLYSGRDFFVMIIKGPNARNDFHQVDSEEFFIQLKGDVAVKTIEGGSAGELELADAVFGAPVRQDILQRCVVWQLSRRQQGTHKSKGRAEVTATAKKMYAQKGTGRARHGNEAAPQFRGGGKALWWMVGGSAFMVQFSAWTFTGAASKAYADDPAGNRSKSTSHFSTTVSAAAAAGEAVLLPAFWPQAEVNQSAATPAG